MSESQRWTQDKVIEFFSKSSNYLDITGLDVRREIIAEAIGHLRNAQILDVGCGDGSLSVPLLGTDNRLTLVDLSPAMLEAARQRVPLDDATRVEFVQGDLHELAPRSYDAVVCIGVLAHVPNVEEAVLGLSRRVREGGTLVLQFTDHDKLSYLPALYWRRTREMLSPGYGYRLQETTNAQIAAVAARGGLTAIRSWRYLALPPLVRRFATIPQACAFERFTGRNKLLAKLGYEVIVAYRR